MNTKEVNSGDYMNLSSGHAPFPKVVGQHKINLMVLLWTFWFHFELFEQPCLIGVLLVYFDFHLCMCVGFCGFIYMCI